MMIELRVKNMVCDRCLRTVQRIFTAHGLDVRELSLGRVVVADLPAAVRTALAAALDAEGFALLDDPKAQLVEQVKQVLLAHIRSEELSERNGKLSDYLAQRLDRDYASLSAAFRSTENVTLEHWFILQKTEFAKELLAYDEGPIKEIAYRLGYSSTAHFANQFRQVTGFTPAEFRRLKAHPRRPIDQVAGP